MIKLKLTKLKIAALINIVTDIIQTLQQDRERLAFSLKRAEIIAHIEELEALSKKLRKKLISVEDRFSEYKFSFSIRKMEGYLLILYRNDYSLVPEKSYYVLTMQQISEPIFKNLLAA